MVLEICSVLYSKLNVQVVVTERSLDVRVPHLILNNGVLNSSVEECTGVSLADFVCRSSRDVDSITSLIKPVEESGSVVLFPMLMKMNSPEGFISCNRLKQLRLRWNRNDPVFAPPFGRFLIAKTYLPLSSL